MRRQATSFHEEHRSRDLVSLLLSLPVLLRFDKENCFSSSGLNKLRVCNFFHSLSNQLFLRPVFKYSYAIFFDDEHATGMEIVS
jgi:hypothetical protein